ncbi:hypothetical protein D3C85_1658510 [compost metagenome]
MHIPNRSVGKAEAESVSRQFTAGDFLLCVRRIKGQGEIQIAAGEQGVHARG